MDPGTPGATPTLGAPHPDPEGHAAALVARFGLDAATGMARCYGKQLSAGGYWCRVLTASEELQDATPAAEGQLMNQAVHLTLVAPQAWRNAAISPESHLAAYYRAPAVRARLAEYCGGTSLHDSPVYGFAAYGGSRRFHLHNGAPAPVRIDEMGELLEAGADICRSLADRDGTLIQMDIDYVDPDNPAEIHLRPEVCFARIEPVYRAVRRAFDNFGIPTVDLISAHGYHLTTRIPAGTRFHATLVEIGRVGAPHERM